MIKTAKQSRSMRRLGKKGKLWMKFRRELSKEFATLGIESCEVRLKGCQGRFATSWAHGKKRRFLSEDELRHLVCLCCQSCHTVLDLKMTHEEMLRIVRDVIARRESRAA